MLQDGEFPCLAYSMYCLWCVRPAQHLSVSGGFGWTVPRIQALVTSASWLMLHCCTFAQRFRVWLLRFAANWIPSQTRRPSKFNVRERLISFAMLIMLTSSAQELPDDSPDDSPDDPNFQEDLPPSHGEIAWHWAVLSQDLRRLSARCIKMYQDDQDRYAKAVEADSMELQMSQDEPRQGTIRQAFPWSASIIFHPSILLSLLLHRCRRQPRQQHHDSSLQDDRPSLEQRPPDLQGLRKALCAVHAARDFCEMSTYVIGTIGSESLKASWLSTVSNIWYNQLGTNGPTRLVTIPKWSKMVVVWSHTHIPPILKTMESMEICKINMWYRAKPTSFMSDTLGPVHGTLVPKLGSAASAGQPRTSQRRIKTVGVCYWNILELDATYYD